MGVMVLAIGFVVADEFNATITKVDGNKITYQKYQKVKKGEEKKKDGDPVTIEVAKDAKIVKGTVTKGKAEVGDAIEGGLKSDVFTKAGEKGVAARITTSDDNKSVTQVLVITPKKKAAQ
jgi:hypothetical protein